MSDESDGSNNASFVARIVYAIGFVFTILWIGVLIFGLNQNWLRQMPLVGLVMLLAGFVLARHFIVDQMSHRVWPVVDTLLSRSRTSIWMSLLAVSTFAVIGGFAGWRLAIKHTSEEMAAGSAAIGAVLFSLIAIATIGQDRHSQSDQEGPDTFGSHDE
jgi:uncharacterized membrane protein